MRAVTNWRRPSALSPALLAIIVVVGLSVLALIALLFINLLNGPGTSPRPSAPSSSGARATLAPGASPTTRPDNSAGALPTDAPLTAPPTPDGSLTPEQALVAHVPEPIRSSCTVEPGNGRAALVATCSADGGGLTITYLEFATAEDMAAAFANRLALSQIEPSTGRCEDQATWPSESEYSLGGAILGRRLCTDQPGTPTIYWTDDRLNIMGEAAVVSDAVSVERLIQFWTDESGPIP